MVFKHLQNSPKSHLRRLSDETWSENSTQEIIRSHHFHLYEVQLVQEVCGDDAERCIEYCERFLQEQEIFVLQPHFIWMVVSTKTMHVMGLKTTTNYSVGGDIWWQINCPPHSNETGETYFCMLQSFLIPQLDDMPLLELCRVWFQ